MGLISQFPKNSVQIPQDQQSPPITRPEIKQPPLFLPPKPDGQHDGGQAHADHGHASCDEVLPETLHCLLHSLAGPLHNASRQPAVLGELFTNTHCNQPSMNTYSTGSQ